MSSRVDNSHVEVVFSHFLFLSEKKDISQAHERMNDQISGTFLLFSYDYLQTFLVHISAIILDRIAFAISDRTVMPEIVYKIHLMILE